MSFLEMLATSVYLKPAHGFLTGVKLNGHHTQFIFCHAKKKHESNKISLHQDRFPLPKNPGMSQGRNYPYVPILRMGLEPAILF